MKKYLFILLFLICGCSRSFEKPSEDLVKSIIKVDSSRNCGSGTFVEYKGYYFVVTSYHLNLEQPKRFYVDSKEVSLPIKYIGLFKREDVAVILTNRVDNVRYLKLNTECVVPDRVFAYGYKHCGDLVFSKGKIDHYMVLLDDVGYRYYVATTSKIVPGMSGGALVDDEDKVWGIASMIINDKIYCFAPSNIIMKCLDTTVKDFEK